MDTLSRGKGETKRSWQKPWVRRLPSGKIKVGRWRRCPVPAHLSCGPDWMEGSSFQREDIFSLISVEEVAVISQEGLGCNRPVWGRTRAGHTTLSRTGTSTTPPQSTHLDTEQHASASHVLSPHLEMAQYLHRGSLIPLHHTAHHHQLQPTTLHPHLLPPFHLNPHLPVQ